MNKQRIAISASAVAGMVATFLPWASVLGISITGTGAAGQGGDGWITLAIFAVPLLLALLSGKRAETIPNGSKVLCVIPGGINGAVGFYVQNHYSKLGVSVGIGVYLLIIASIAVIILPFLTKLFNKENGGERK